MNKTILFAAALLCAPLPALCQNLSEGPGQNNPAGQAGQPPAYAAENRGMEQGAQGNRPAENMENGAPANRATENMAEEENGRGEVFNLLDRLAQTPQLRDEISSAIERVQNACGSDIDEYCGSITPGGGRIAHCMRANADRLSRRCRFTLFRISGNIRQNVSNMANQCLNGLRSQCGNAQNVGECAEQKSASISPGCHAVVAALRQPAGRNIAELKGTPVYSADNKDVGEILDVQRAPDGKIASVQIQIGRLLGLGNKVITIDADKLQKFGNGFRLQFGSGDIGSLPEAKKSGT